MGLIQIKKTKNNLFMILRDSKNNLLTVLSFGMVGFKKTNRKTYYSCYILAEKMGIKVLNFKIKNLNFEFLGWVRHMKAFISPFQKFSFNIQNVIIKNKINHGGCRLKKKRRK